MDGFEIADPVALINKNLLSHYYVQVYQFQITVDIC